MYPVYLQACVLIKSLWEIKENRAGGNLPDQNAAEVNISRLRNKLIILSFYRLDMTLPVVIILEGAKLCGEFINNFDSARDVWIEDIERYTPGYLQMEAKRNEADYDHSRLINPDETDIYASMY